MSIKDEILAKVSLAQVAGSSARRIQCPFHNSAGKDMVLYHATNRWRCMGACDDGRTHSVIEWVMHRDGLSYNQALRDLAADAGLGDINGERQDILRAATQAWRSALFEHKPALNYLASRGVGEYLVQREFIGYAQGMRTLLEHDLTFQQLSLVGLAYHTPGQAYKARAHFNDHIVMPVRDHSQRLLQVQGRWIGPPDEDQPKYLAMPQNVDLRGPTIYDLLGNVENVSKADTIWMGEGFFDRLTLTGLGLAATNIFGHANLAYHAFGLRKATRLNVVLDPDEASQKRLLDELYSVATRVPHLDIRPMLMPDGEDVNGWGLRRTEGGEFAPGACDALVEELDALAEQTPTLMQKLILAWGALPYERLRLAELIGVQADEEQWVSTWAKQLDKSKAEVQFLVDSCRTNEAAMPKAEATKRAKQQPRKTYAVEAAESVDLLRELFGS